MNPRYVRLVGLVAPVIMAAVAFLSVYQHVAHDQSSWSGAGFGMFATIDGEATRQVRGFMVEPDSLLVPQPLPSYLTREAFEVEVLPTEVRMRNLGQRWLDSIVDPSGDRLAVEVWGIRFDRETGELSRFLIRRVEVGS